MSEARAAGERSVAVGHNAGIASTGNYVHNTLINLPAAGLPPVDGTPAPPDTVRLGAGRGAGVFVGREAELSALSGTTAGAQVLVGLGGAGKSTLARRFARQRRGHDNPVWWVTGRSRELIETGLAELAARLAPVFSGLPVPIASSWARGWLARNPGWLLVLDDVGGPEDVRDLLEEFPDGRFLLTSRQGAGWQGLARPVRVGELGADEALDVLEHVIRDGSAGEPDLTGAAELCERLGRLPLALEQAGAFIAQNAISPERYLAMLRADGSELLDRGAVGTDPARTVGRIWRVTFDRLAEDPEALGILRVLAWYAPTDIPRPRSGFADSAGFAAALNLLAAYHLVTLTADTIGVHPLVQEITRTPRAGDPHSSPEAIEQARRLATSLMVSAASRLTSTDPAQWPACRKLFPHIEAIAAHSDPEQDDGTLLELLSWLGQSLQAQGEYRRALKHVDRSVAGLTRLSGADHDRTLARRVTLAQILKATGERDAAAALSRETLERAERSLGPAHETTLTARAAVAADLSAAGRDDEAIARMRDLLEVGLEKFGEGHLFVDMVRSNLAFALARAGAADQAAAMYDVEYKSRLARGGPDDAGVLLVENNLAFALQQAGDLERAIALYEDVVERRERVLGEEHPYTLESVANLATAVVQAGDIARARKLTERVLEARERALGPDHPDTRDAREGLRMMKELLATEELPAAPSAHSTASQARRRSLNGFLRALGRRGLG